MPAPNQANQAARSCRSRRPTDVFQPTEDVSHLLRNEPELEDEYSGSDGEERCKADLANARAARALRGSSTESSVDDGEEDASDEGNGADDSDDEVVVVEAIKAAPRPVPSDTPPRPILKRKSAATPYPGSPKKRAKNGPR